MPECKNCKSKRIVKNGIVKEKQRYKCKECGYNFVVGDGRTNEKIAAKKAMCVLLYTLSKASYNGLARIFDTLPSLVYRWIVEAGANLPNESVSGDIKHMEFDEMWHFIGSKKQSYGSLKPLIVRRRTVAWVLGGRDSKTFRRLYDKVKHLKTCTFYTDDWDAFSKVLPSERHVIGKAHTIAIEQDNSNTRHYLGRFTRKSKIVS
ncbi:MAG: IS1 family transposase [Oscillospiraceae bacterium]|jgi:IS1 family transposase/transposase-like protein|nr:IS1 family transposase [Oscillospiraceae bacterium]